MIMVFLINALSCGFGTPTIVANGVIVAVAQGTATDAVAFITPTAFPVVVQGCVVIALFLPLLS